MDRDRIIAFEPFSSSNGLPINGPKHICMMFTTNSSLHIETMLKTCVFVINRSDKVNRLIDYNAQLLFDLTAKMVMEDTWPLSLETATVVDVCNALVSYKDRKVEYHNREHKDYGVHWGTGTPFYKWNPAHFVNKIGKRYGCVETFDASYRVQQGEGKIFEMAEAE